jgi:NAD+ synthase (glutamine-hydrolysing)
MVRIALCQANLPVGDLDGNVERIRTRIGHACDQGADLIVFPELSLTGYPPEDLLLRPSFSERAHDAVRRLAADIHDAVVLVGFPYLSDDLFNAAAVLADGQVQSIYRKCLLPNYSVFDEQRYFASGNRGLVLDLGGVKVGVTICEDLWYPSGPGQWEAADGDAQLVVNLSASPYHRSKGIERERMFKTRCLDYSCFLAFCNAVGGQDELVFDGHSLIMDPNGEILARGRQFEEDLVIADIDANNASRRLHAPRWQQHVSIETDHVDHVSLPTRVTDTPPLARLKIPTLLTPEAEVYRALVLGTGDYFRKNGFNKAVIGLSGGIDSALTLVIAAEALGPESVTAVAMPSRYTTTANRTDAAELANRLGVTLLETPIHKLVAAYDSSLAPLFGKTEIGVTEENLQARIRGNLLMALSNKFSWLVLTPGHKREMSVGYATLYGDMAGGFSVLKDVLKIWVYRISKWCNREREIIPHRIIDKAPSAELRDNQLDTDTLPPYDTLDAVLQAYVENDRTPGEIEALGFEPAMVRRIVDMVDKAEYKRRQAPPGIRITTRAFGKDRRFPITNKFKAE